MMAATPRPPAISIPELPSPCKGFSTEVSGFVAVTGNGDADAVTAGPLLTKGALYVATFFAGGAFGINFLVSASVSQMTREMFG